MNNSEHTQEMHFNAEHSAMNDAENSMNQSSGDQQQLNQCQRELQEWKERCLRGAADFENFKRREEKARLQVTRYAQSELVTGLLPIIDNFERALKQKKQDEIAPELQSWFAGIVLIDKDLQKYFTSIGLQEIKEATEFDPQLHEAVMTVQSSDIPSGTIVEVLQKGYRFKDSVIRPAKVSIAQ